MWIRDIQSSKLISLRMRWINQKQVMAKFATKLIQKLRLLARYEIKDNYVVKNEVNNLF